MGQLQATAISQLRRKNAAQFKRLQWRNSTLFRQFYAFLSDRSLSFTTATLAIYGMITDASMTDMLFMVGANPFITVAICALPFFMLWNQYVTYRKQKRFEEKCQEIEAEIRDNVETAYRIRHRLMGRKFTAEQQEAIEFEIARIMTERSVHMFQPEASLFKNDLDYMVRTWKRTVSPAARSTWVAIIFMSFVPTFGFSTGLLGMIVAISMMIFMMFLTKHLYFQKQHNQQKLDKLREIRASSLDVLKEAQSESFKHMKEVAHEKDALYAKIKDLETQLRQPSLCAMQREKLIKYRRCLIQKYNVLSHKLTQPGVNEEIRDYDQERDVKAWHKAHGLISFFTIIPSLGIGSSIISALTKMGATEWVGASGYVPFFSVLAIIVFVGAMIEFVASYVSTQQSLSRSLKAQDEIRILQNRSQQLTEAMTPEQYERYVHWYQQSATMRLFSQFDHEMSDTFMERRSADYVGMKFFKKLYKGTKALSFVLVMQAFNIIPGGILAPLIVVAVMGVISLMEYTVKTKNRFHLKRLEHEVTYLKEDLALKQQAYEYVGTPKRSQPMEIVTSAYEAPKQRPRVNLSMPGPAPHRYLNDDEEDLSSTALLQSPVITF